MKTTRALILSLFFFIAIVFAFSCSKKSNSGSTKLELRLTDDPASYDAVYIDIRKIEINGSSDSGTSSGWTELDLLKPGVYDLLKFRNGLDTLLAATDVPAGRINQIRLILGDSNYVVVGGEWFPLSTPSAQQSGIKLNLHADLTAGIVYRLWLDFDAMRSIVLQGNGSYLLKPVIRTYADAIGGSIKGYVLPLAADAEVWAAQSADTVLALPDSATGYYYFGGMNAGSWDLLIHARNAAYRDTAFTVQVSTGVVTDAGTTTLQAN